MIVDTIIKSYTDKLIFKEIILSKDAFFFNISCGILRACNKSTSLNCTMEVEIKELEVNRLLNLSRGLDLLNC